MASHKKVRPTPKYSPPAYPQQTSQPINTYQQPVPQQTAQPITQIAQPTPEIKKIENIIEKHQFCPYCGAIAKGDYCAECGEKID